MKIWCSALAVAVVVLAVMTGCGGGGDGGDSIALTPMERTNRTLEEKVADLMEVSERIGGTTFVEGELSDLLGGNIEYILSDWYFPSMVEWWYPLYMPYEGEACVASSTPQPSSNVKRLAGISKIASRLARNIAPEGRATRETETIDFVSPEGVHWTGTYSYTDASAKLNVTGYIDDLTVTFKVEVTDTGDDASGSFEGSFSMTVVGQVNDYEGQSIPVSAAMSGTLKSSYTDTKETGSITESSSVKIAGKVVQKESLTMLMTMLFDTQGVFTSLTGTLTGSSTLFAPDGYWVTSSVKFTLSTDVISGSVKLTASDGVTAYWENASGWVKDKNGVKVADLMFNGEEGHVTVDFVDPTLADQTFYLFML